MNPLRPGSPIRARLSSVTATQTSWAIQRRQRAVIGDALLRHARGRLVDIGCGTKPYALLLKGRVESHLGVDRADSPHGMKYVDVVGDAFATGLTAESADTVLMSQVFEHLEEPLAALRESFRILAPGGAMVLSTNFAWHEHEAPRDFFRYTRFGLEYLFREAGFVVDEVRPMAGTWLTLGAEAAYALRRLASRRPYLAPITLPLGHFTQLVGLGLDRLSYDPALTDGYVVVAHRPPRDQPRE